MQAEKNLFGGVFYIGGVSRRNCSVDALSKSEGNCCCMQLVIDGRDTKCVCPVLYFNDDDYIVVSNLIV